jgi:hypothetical protein
MLKLKLTESKKEYNLDNVKFNKEEKYFSLRSSENPEIEIEVQYLLNVVDTYNADQFKLFSFVNSSLSKEENIFEVHVDRKSVNRIGWAFPIQALNSTYHTKADNVHFLRYAFVSFQKLLRGEYFKEDHVFELASFNQEVNITEIYNSQLIVLCLSTEKTNLIHGFELSDYLHSLYSFRYFWIDSAAEFFVESEPIEINDDTSRIRISEISRVLKGDIFIISLFKTHLKLNNHPIVHFHLLYQIVELLINRVYDCEIEKLLVESKDKTKSPHDLLMASNKLQTEKYRIVQLIDNYLKQKPASTPDLIRLCKDALSIFEKEKIQESDKSKIVADLEKHKILRFIDNQIGRNPASEDNLSEIRIGILSILEKEKLQTTDIHIGEAFYTFRNAVVHNLRGLAQLDYNFEQFNQINIQFEKYIIDILSSYQEPDTSFEMEELPLAWLLYLEMKSFFEDNSNL